MAIKNAIRDYVRNFYEITYDPKHKQIMLHDSNETYNNRNYIDIGRVGRVKITLVWGKIEEITGLAYHHKDFQSELSDRKSVV